MYSTRLVIGETSPFSNLTCQLLNINLLSGFIVAVYEVFGIKKFLSKIHGLPVLHVVCVEWHLSSRYE